MLEYPNCINVTGMEIYIIETSLCSLKWLLIILFISVLTVAVLKITFPLFVLDDHIASYILLLLTAGLLTPFPGVSSLQEIGCETK